MPTHCTNKTILQGLSDLRRQRDRLRPHHRPAGGLLRLLPGHVEVHGDVLGAGGAKRGRGKDVGVQGGTELLLLLLLQLHSDVGAVSGKERLKILLILNSRQYN